MQRACLKQSLDIVSAMVFRKIRVVLGISFAQAPRLILIEVVLAFGIMLCIF